MKSFWLLAALLAASGAAPAAEPLAGFVLIKGGILHRGAPGAGQRERVQMRVEDYEILDHPVTNAEYRRFVAATKHRHHCTGWVAGFRRARTTIR